MAPLAPTIGSTYFYSSGSSFSGFDSVVPGGFGLYNFDSTHNLNVSILKNGNVIATTIVQPSSNKSFTYGVRFWIYATTDFNQSIAISDINTEISALGIISADIVITGGSGSPFSFSLSNIQF